MRVGFDGTVTNVTDRARRAQRGRRRTDARRAQLDAHDRSPHLGVEARQGEARHPVRNAERPLVEPQRRADCASGRASSGPRCCCRRYREPGRKLPVLLDPYGGPAPPDGDEGAELRSSRRSGSPTRGSPCSSIDGRGTPGRGSTWERAVHLDLAGPVLEDQVDALQLVAAGPSRARPRAGRDPRLVVRRLPGRARRAAPARRLPRRGRRCAGDRVAAVRHALHRALPRRSEGERRRRTTAAACSAIATSLRRPLLLIHGLADDNVVAAHTLQMSRVLLEAGRSHNVLPLSGVTHMTPQEVVAENLLLLQVAFLRQSLGLSIA